MLANGATLSYKKKSDTEKTYTKLEGLKEIPDCGVDPEKVDNTGLEDKNKQYDMGIGDLGDMKYKFKWDNTSANSPYRLMRAAEESGEVLSFQEKLKDGTVTEYDAQVATKRTGGTVNGLIEFELTMIIQSDIKVTDPA
jgi:hypothetical protein